MEMSPGYLVGVASSLVVGGAGGGGGQRLVISHIAVLGVYHENSSLLSITNL